MQLQHISLESPPKILKVATGAGKKGEINKYFHDFWSMHIPNWNGKITIDNNSFDVKSGDLIITPPYSHTEFFFTTSDSHTYIQFNCKTEDIINIPIICNNFKTPLNLHKWGEEIHDVFPKYPHRATAMLWNLLWKAHGTCPSSDIPNTDNFCFSVRRGIEYIEKRLSGYITAKEIAKEIGVSINHLNRLFRKDIGKTVWEHVIHRRMDTAFHLLTRTTGSITNIAKSCGYDNIQHFNKSIRKFHGNCPRKIRNIYSKETIS